MCIRDRAGQDQISRSYKAGRRQENMEKDDTPTFLQIRWQLMMISFHCWDKTTCGFVKRTAAILEFYFRFRFQSMHSHRHVILHRHAKFRSNRTIGGGVMTSNRFFKMAAIEPENYFRVWWRNLFRKDVVYLHTLSLIHIWRCRRSTLCRSRWSPYH